MGHLVCTACALASDGNAVVCIHMTLPEYLANIGALSRNATQWAEVLPDSDAGER